MEILFDLAEMKNIATDQNMFQSIRTYYTSVIFNMT